MYKNTLLLSGLMHGKSVISAVRFSLIITDVEEIFLMGVTLGSCWYEKAILGPGARNSVSLVTVCKNRMSCVSSRSC